MDMNTIKHMRWLIERIEKIEIFKEALKAPLYESNLLISYKVNSSTQKTVAINDEARILLLDYYENHYQEELERIKNELREIGGKMEWTN